jgi:hypothetical protein
MARQHGKDVRVYLGGRDASGDLSTITPTISAATHDVTTFASAGYIEHDPGLLSWEATVEGWYDPAAGGIGRQFEDLLGASGGVLSVYEDDANAIGDTGQLYSDSLLSQRGQPISVNEMVKLSGALKPTGSGTRAGLYGKLLHVLGEETVTGTENSLDNTAATDAGGRANLHITAITGTWTIKVEHSTNNSDWEDLATFSGKTAIGGHTVEVTGDVYRYLRASHTETVAGSVTYVLGFARY